MYLWFFKHSTLITDKITTCKYENCNLNRYKDNECCILHADLPSKPPNDFRKTLLEQSNKAYTLDTKNSNVIFEKVYFPDSSLSISKIVDLKLTDTTNTITFKDCRIYSPLSLIGFEYTFFEHCTFEKKFDFDFFKLIGSNQIVFNYNTFNQEFYVNGKDFNDNWFNERNLGIYFFECIFKSHSNLFTNVLFKQGFQFSCNSREVENPNSSKIFTFDKVTFYNSDISWNALDLNIISSSFKGLTRFQDFSRSPKKSVIRETSLFDSITFQDELEELTFDNIQNYGDVLFKDAQIYIENFQNTSFHNMRFFNVQWLDIEDSFIERCIVEVLKPFWLLAKDSWIRATYPINNFFFQWQSYFKRTDKPNKINCKQLRNYYLNSRDFETAEKFYKKDMNITFSQSNCFLKIILTVYYIFFGYGVEPVRIFWWFIFFNIIVFPFLYAIPSIPDTGLIKSFTDGLTESFSVCTLQNSTKNICIWTIGLQKLIGIPLLAMFFISIRRKYKI